MEWLPYEDAAVIPNLFTVVVNVRAENLRGPKVRTTPDSGNGALDTYLWEWTR
jgi:hypothetical protein